MSKVYSIWLFVLVQYPQRHLGAVVGQPEEDVHAVGAPVPLTVSVVEGVPLADSEKQNYFASLNSQPNHPTAAVLSRVRKSVKK